MRKNLRTYEVRLHDRIKVIEADSWDFVDGYLCFFTKKPRIDVALFKDWETVLLLHIQKDDES